MESVDKEKLGAVMGKEHTAEEIGRGVIGVTKEEMLAVMKDMVGREINDINKTLE